MGQTLANIPRLDIFHLQFRIAGALTSAWGRWPALHRGQMGGMDQDLHEENGGLQHGDLI